MSEIRYCKSCRESIPHDVGVQTKVGGEWLADDGAFAVLGALVLAFPETRTVAQCQKCDEVKVIGD